MNANVMVLLVGEQPAPNVLPLRHYNPAHVALVHTDKTCERARRLAGVIGTRVAHPFCVTEPYPLDKIQASLQAYLDERQWTGDKLIFNLTGGTKTMALAAYEVARQMDAQAFYYQTEDNQNLIHPYRFERGNLLCEPLVPIEATLTLDDYLRLYVGECTEGKLKEPFERLVEEALRAHLPGYEVKTSVRLKELAGHVEVDLLVRYGNQVAVLEVKRQGKKGIDQLNGVTDQRTLGTYTRKILVSIAPLDENNLELARAYRITPVVLASGAGSQLADGDVRQLVDAVRHSLEPKSSQARNPGTTRDASRAKSEIRDPK